jgi:hypothetical protein
MQNVTFKQAGMLCLALSLGGCAMVMDMSKRVFATPTNALAIVGEQVLIGDVVLGVDRTGSVTLNAEKGQPDSCIGSMRYTSTMAGTIDLRCSGAVAAELQFRMLGNSRGYAYGQSDKVAVSLTFGLSNQEARAYLVVPPNKKLVENPESELLELQ